MRPYVIKVAAGQEEPYSFGSGRNFIRLDESATVTVTVKSPDTGEETNLKSGDWVSLTEFDELRFSHNGIADTVFTVWVGKNTRQGGSRVGGSVQVTGGSDNDTNPPFFIPRDRESRKGSRFIYLPVTGGVEITLNNPASSGVDIYLTSLKTINGADVSFLIGKSDIEAVDLVDAASAFFNKKLSGPATVLQGKRNFSSLITLTNKITLVHRALYAQHEHLGNGSIHIGAGEIFGLSLSTGLPGLIFEYEEVPL